MIDRYPHSDKSIPVFIADRGFHAFNVFAHAIERKSYFLIRAKDVRLPTRHAIIFLVCLMGK